ncbi:MAG TPA: cysteine--tRNA ligase [Acidimicrobiia bacterium]|nr:cysteine--tRNA ligase [Acidimicrobiia bacterium]
MLRLHNTLTRTVEPIRPLRPGAVSMYSCGPTVYRPVHIGNLRSFLLGDLIRRALDWTGVSVRQVMNITDVGHMTDEIYDRGEDKMLLAAADEGLSPAEIAAKYEAAFHRDAGRLGILPAEAYPKASDHIGAMIDLIGRLLERGHAYVDAGTVYYDVTTFPDYGRLSRNSLDRLRAGHRLEAVDHHKRHPADFILWKAAGPRRVVRFDSPWGEGYPGWHIECSAMSIAYLGERFDIHTGGVDLAFPHHEDEIAQSEGALGHPVVSTWVHGDHLLFSGQKMAKSSGNVWTLDRLQEEGHHPLDFRYLCLTSRYRRQLRFTAEALAAAGKARARLAAHVADWGAVPPDGAGVAGSATAKEWDLRFRDAVLDDLDFPRALTVVWGLVGEDGVTAGERAALLADWDRVLGLGLAEAAGAAGAAQTEEDLPPGADALLESRRAARERRDWAESDRLRDALGELGVDVTDTRQGTNWRLRR